LFVCFFFAFLQTAGHGGRTNLLKLVGLFVFIRGVVCRRSLLFQLDLFVNKKTKKTASVGVLRQTPLEHKLCFVLKCIIWSQCARST